MRYLIRFLLVILFAVPAAHGTTYFIAPASGGGSDANSGLDSGHPWLTRLHNTNCGDVISAVAGTYDEANFRLGTMNAVNCPSGNNVTALHCAVFDACKIVIATAAHDAMGISQSYWQIDGWDVTVSNPSTNACFIAFPPNNTTQIHHVIFANNVAHGCGDGTFTVGAVSATVGVDYISIIGNISYNGAQDNANCYSNIDIVFPVNSDTVPGTHIYVAGNISWGALDPNPCGGVTPTDGHGLLFDSWNQSSYSGQAVAENNILVWNGGAGFQIFANNAGAVYLRQNTLAGNQTGSINANPCPEVTVNTAINVVSSKNLAVTNGATACNGSPPLYALGSSFDAASDIFSNNFLYSAAGNNFVGTSAVFSGNLTGTDPLMANAAQPGAPNCTGKASVPDCASAIIAGFTASAPSAVGYGYQTPSNTPNVNPFYPAWMCTVTTLPSGLVTPGCAASGAASSMGSGAQLSHGATIH